MVHMKFSGNLTLEGPSGTLDGTPIGAQTAGTRPTVSTSNVGSAYNAGLLLDSLLLVDRRLLVLLPTR